MKNPSKGIFGIHDVDQGTRRMNYEVSSVCWLFLHYIRYKFEQAGHMVFQFCVKV